MPSEAEVEAAALAMFCRLSTNEDAAWTWREINQLPQHATTVIFYREQARAALEAAERAREAERLKSCKHPTKNGSGTISSDGKSSFRWWCPDCGADL